MSAGLTPKAQEGIKGPLLAELTPEQEEDLKSSGGFNVRGSDNKIYRVLGHWGNNILGYGYRCSQLSLLGYYPVAQDEFGGRYRVEGLDRLLMQKIILECDAPKVCYKACCDPAFSNDIRRMEEVGDYEGKI